MSTIRPPTKKKPSKPTDRHTSISDGNEKKVLGGLFFCNGKWFNQRDFSRKNRIAKTTINDTLNRLVNKKYCSKLSLGVYVITDLGKQAFQGLKAMSDSSIGSVGNEAEKHTVGIFSTHYLKYVAKITDESLNWKDNLNKLNPNNIKELNNKNNPQYYLYFDDCTVIISKHKIIVRIHDIINNDSDIALLESFNKALDKFTDCKKIGLITESMILEDSHYAQMNTYFAEVLDKVKERYFIELEDKTKFWIDRSHGPLELETNKKELQENIDSFIRYESENDITGEMTQIKQNLLELTEYNKNFAELLTANMKLTQTELSTVFKSIESMNQAIKMITDTLRSQIKPIQEEQEEDKIKPIPRYIN